MARNRTPPRNVVGGQRLGRTFPAEILTGAEMRALIRAGSTRSKTGRRNVALIAILCGSGLRISEALALRASDIDFDACSIRVLHGKGDKARTVGLDPFMAATVERWVAERKTLSGKLLFCTLEGSPLNQSYVRGMLKRLATRAGVDKTVRPHGLRHSVAVQMDREGTGARTIQLQLGHASLDATQIYLSSISGNDCVEAMRKRRTHAELGGNPDLIEFA